MEGLRWGTPEPEKEPLPFEEKHGNLNPKPSTKPRKPKPKTLNPKQSRSLHCDDSTVRRKAQIAGNSSRLAELREAGLRGFGSFRAKGFQVSVLGDGLGLRS